jgi:hypothetical protein
MDSWRETLCVTRERRRPSSVSVDAGGNSQISTKMKNFSPSSIAAVFLMLWMWLMTIAIIELFKMSDSKIDFSICPLCDKSNLE